MVKNSKLYSILRFKCPKCYKGDFYKAKHPYELSKMGKRHTHCSNCGFKYEIETGFFQGSYYVTYALGVALFVGSCGLGYAFGIRHPLGLFFFFLGALLVSTPIIYALSKIIWLNVFISGEEDLKEK